MARYMVTVEGKEYDVELEYHSEYYKATLNGREVHVNRQRLDEKRSLLLIDNRSHEVDIRSDGYDNRLVVFMQGRDIPVEIEDYHLAQLRKTAGMASGPAVEKTLKAPMPGLILEINIKPGDKVAKGAPLMIVEAMKMENIIKAPAEAVVKAVHVDKGASVERNDRLLEFE